MRAVTVDEIKSVYLPPPTSHKGQNGRLLVIGGSRLQQKIRAHFAGRILCNMPVNFKELQSGERFPDIPYLGGPTCFHSLFPPSLNEFHLLR